MTRKQKAPEKPRTAADVAPDLEDDLRVIAENVQPHQYARATARDFAIGKYSARRRRKAYALT